MSAHVGSPLPWSKAWSRANWDEARAPDRPGGGCPVCALTSGVPCQPGCQRRVRPAPRATPGLKGARGRGRGSPTARGGAARAGGSPLRPQAADSPARVARLAARGAGCGRDPGAPAGGSAPRARPQRGFRHGPRAPARPPRWRGVGAPAPTESASRAYAWGEFSGTRELGAGVDCQKVHRACTRGASFLASGRWRWGSPSETPPHVYTRDEASDV
jgi:hypothetical protein